MSFIKAKDKKFASFIGKNARQIIKKDYSWEKIAKKTLEVYRKL